MSLFINSSIFIENAYYKKSYKCLYLINILSWKTQVLKYFKKTELKKKKKKSLQY